MTSNFDFVPTEWGDARADTIRAESHGRADPRSSVFYARPVLEQIVVRTHLPTATTINLVEEKVASASPDPGSPWRTDSATSSRGPASTRASHSGRGTSPSVRSQVRPNPSTPPDSQSSGWRSRSSGSQISRVAIEHRPQLEVDRLLPTQVTPGAVHSN